MMIVIGGKMKRQGHKLEERIVKLLLCAIITMVQIRLGNAFTDTLSLAESNDLSAYNSNSKSKEKANNNIQEPPNNNKQLQTNNHHHQQQQQQQMMMMNKELQLHQTMSCFACSTMDYENTADNLCRYMKQHYHHRSPAGLPTTSSAHHYSFDYTTTNPTSQQQTSPASGTYNYQHQDLSPSLSNQQQQQLVVSNNQTIQPHKSPLISSFGNSIRTRPCFEDENFCSIVSVVRIEFVNDTLISRFWAMERNCSKSCNTGCMLIGERVRLRVCSQCCRTPNCNIGSGTNSTNFNISHKYINLLIIIISHLIYSIIADKY